MASGHPQEGPSRECIRLRRYPDRFVARAHSRPLRQNVSIKNVELYSFCQPGIRSQVSIINFCSFFPYTQVPRTRLARTSGRMGRKSRRGILPVRRNRRGQHGHTP